MYSSGILCPALQCSLGRTMARERRRRERERERGASIVTESEGREVTHISDDGCGDDEYMLLGVWLLIDECSL